MVPAAQYDRATEQLSEATLRWEAEEAKTQELVTQWNEERESLDRELQQHQRIFAQFQDLLSAGARLSSGLSPSKHASLSSSASSSLRRSHNGSTVAVDWKQSTSVLLDRIAELVQQEKTHRSFFKAWSEAFQAAGINDAQDVDNDELKVSSSAPPSAATTISYHYLQRLQSFLPQIKIAAVPPTATSTASSLSSSSLDSSRFQDLCITHFLQPLLREYEQVRQDYEATYYFYTAQLQEVERLTQQCQTSEEQIVVLRQQRQQQEELYRQNIAHFEEEQQRLFQSQEEARQAHQEEMTQLNQRWELKFQQAEQHWHRQQESLTRQAQLTTENELLAQQQKHESALKAKESDLQKLHDQLRSKEHQHHSLEDVLREKVNVRCKRCESTSFAERMNGMCLLRVDYRPRHCNGKPKNCKLLTVVCSSCVNKFISYKTPKMPPDAVKRMTTMCIVNKKL